jgi:hypothetical protein
LQRPHAVQIINTSILKGRRQAKNKLKDAYFVPSVIPFHEKIKQNCNHRTANYNMKEKHGQSI